MYFDGQRRDFLYCYAIVDLIADDVATYVEPPDFF